MPEAKRDPHRVRAYLKAALSVEAHAEPLTALHAKGRLVEVPGVGPKIAKFIANLIEPEPRSDSRTGLFEQGSRGLSLTTGSAGRYLALERRKDAV